MLEIEAYFIIKGEMEANEYTPCDTELSNLELHIEKRNELRNYYRQVYAQKKLIGEIEMPILKTVTRK